jgi:parallel beta-helix repeat protein
MTHNLSEYNALCAFAVSQNSSNCLIQYNTGSHCGYYTETMQFPGSTTFDFFSVGPSNVCDGNLAEYQQDLTGNDGQGFINDTSNYPVRFTNNIAYRNYGSGITFTLSSGNVAINNTCIENGYGSTTTFNGVGIRWGQGSINNVVENNILLNNRVAGIHAVGLPTQTVDFNLYSQSGQLLHDGYNQSSGSYTTLASIKSAGYELHGLSGNPLLDPAYTPQVGSPALGSANPLVAPPKDFNGTTRSTKPAIGAIE